MKTNNQSTIFSSNWGRPDLAGRREQQPGRKSILGITALMLILATSVVARSQVASDTRRTHPTPSAPTRVFTPASFLALPELRCKIYAPATTSASITVFSDHDGYVRFHAVKATSADAIQRLNMDCTDNAGKSYSYSVDLTADDTFVPRPLNLANEPGRDRPGLTGDPLSYSEAELIQAGYGPRPDPKDAGAYGRWLEAARAPGRMLYAKRPTHFSATVSDITANPWSGSILAGAPNYISTEATFNVPPLLPGADETQSTISAIWNGLGGFNTGSGLIQGGVGLSTTFSAASYSTWREYCCGDPDSNGYGGNFVPNVNDKIYDVEWYCDSKGNKNINGGYGCSHLHDLTSGAIFDCSSSTGSPCWSVKALPLCSVKKVTNCMTLGVDAEFIIENQSPQLTPPETQWTPFSGTVSMSGSAYSSKTGSYSQTISTDSQVYVAGDFEDESSHMIVSLGKTNQTNFVVSQFAPIGGTAANAAGTESIGVGPNQDGTTIGDAWILGEPKDSGGDYPIFQLQGTSWIKQVGSATHISVGPDGYPWVINHLGKVYFWNGSSFELTPAGGCATWIGVGPNAFGSKFDNPWIIGCDGGAGKDGSIYQLQGSSWVRMPGGATKIAVSPEGIPWVVNVLGSIYYWNGSSFSPSPINGCATSIAVASNTVPLAGPNGDVWILGCTKVGSSYDVYQMINGTSWGLVPGSGIQISVSPFGGVPWVIASTGKIYE